MTDVVKPMDPQKMISSQASELLLARRRLVLSLGRWLTWFNVGFGVLLAALLFCAILTTVNIANLMENLFAGVCTFGLLMSVELLAAMALESLLIWHYDSGLSVKLCLSMSEASDLINYFEKDHRLSVARLAPLKAEVLSAR